MERLTKWEGKTADGKPRAALVKRDGAFITIFLEAVAKLAQYEDAEEQGRLIVLPDNYDEIYNKRGDNIYALIDGDLHELLMTDTFIGEEHTLMIDCFEVDDVWVEEGGEPIEKEMPKTYGFPIYDIGKYVFLSQEEAEKVLEGMK